MFQELSLSRQVSSNIYIERCRFVAFKLWLIFEHTIFNFNYFFVCWIPLSKANSTACILQLSSKTSDIQDKVWRIYNASGELCQYRRILKIKYFLNVFLSLYFDRVSNIYFAFGQLISFWKQLMKQGIITFTDY